MPAGEILAVRLAWITGCKLPPRPHLVHIEGADRTHLIQLSQEMAKRTGKNAEIHAQPSRCSRWSPTRTALAIAVRAGFTALMLGKKLVSTT